MSMKAIEIAVFKTNDVLNVTATINSRGLRDGKLRFKTEDIEKRLKEDGVKFGKCLKSDVLTNGVKSKKIGEWIFVNPSVKKKSTKKRSSRKEQEEALNSLVEETEKLGLYDDEFNIEDTIDKEIENSLDKTNQTVVSSSLD